MRSAMMPVIVVLFLSAVLLEQQIGAQVPEAEVPVVSPTYIAPPAPLQETIVAAPSPQAVWVSGHWDRTPDKWNWISGTWVKPPFANAYWVPGYWQHQQGKFVWEDAHWAGASQGLVVAKPVTVPAAYKEVQPVAPGGTTAWTWQPGYWQWRGTWVWIPGTYVESTVADASWVPGQWAQTLGGAWRWIPAHWANPS